MSQSDDYLAQRERYLSDVEKSVKPHENKSFEYEKLAIAYSEGSYKILTYLYGGALLAIPAAVALFAPDMGRAKFNLLASAGFFVSALMFVATSHALAFFTMAKRSESQTRFAFFQSAWASATHYPERFKYEDAKAEAEEHEKAARELADNSNAYRFWAIVTAYTSAGLFLLGAAFGASAILG